MSRRIRIDFNTTDGGTVAHSYNYAKDSETVTTTQLRELCETELANGDIYEKVPLSVKKVQIITTNEQDVTPSDITPPN